MSRWPATRVTERLGIPLPIVQAPLAGASTLELVAASSNAGALGSLPASRMTPEELRESIRALRSMTSAPFNVNVFVWPEPPESPPEVHAALDAALRPHRAALGLPADLAPSQVPDFHRRTAAQLSVIAEERVPVFSFTLGIPPLDEIRASGAVTIGTATSVAEALALQDAGVDVVSAQFAEAGGHRGAFLGDPARQLVGGFALVPQIADAVDIPVLAAGGIMDGRGIAAALALGADGVQMGTAFLGCPEAAIPPAHRAALAATADTGTSITRHWSGRAARAVRNAFVEDVEAAAPEPLGFPAHLGYTGPIQRAAAEVGDPERMYMFAGQGTAMLRSLPAAQLIATLAREAEQALADLGE